jgi:hypothetical protein
VDLYVHSPIRKHRDNFTFFLTGHCNELSHVPRTLMKGIKIPSITVHIFEKEIQERIHKTA